MRKLFVVMMLALVGCQNAEQPQPMPVVDRTVTSAPQDVANSDNSLVSIRLSVPKQVKINETFQIEVRLKNNSDREFVITTGDPAFDYRILDSSGQPIGTISAKTDAGIAQPLPGDGIIFDHYPYQFNTAGTYEISASAKFTLQDGGDSTYYDLTTTSQQIEVTE